MKYLYIKTVDAYSDKEKQGVHLLNPSEIEIENARETAQRDRFNRIYIHVESPLIQLRAKYLKFKTRCKSSYKVAEKLAALVEATYPVGSTIDLSDVGFKLTFGGGYGSIKKGIKGKVLQSGYFTIVVDVNGECLDIDILDKPCGQDNLAQLEFNRGNLSQDVRFKYA